MRCTLTYLLCLVSIAAYCQLESNGDSNTQKTLLVADSIEFVSEPKISFDAQSLNLGTIKEDTIVHRMFNFKNSGSDTLIILSTKADCSCTVPKVLKSSYAPGETGTIKVSFNSKQNIGRFLQYVTVFHNAKDGYTYLKLEGFVEGQL